MGYREHYDRLYHRLMMALIHAPAWKREDLRSDWAAWARRSGLWAAACRETRQWA